VVALIGISVVVVRFRRRQRKADQQLSLMGEKLEVARNAANRAPLILQPESPDQDVPAVDGNKGYLSPEDKLFLRKLILAVMQMMDHQAVTVTMVADKMCMSPKTLNRKVKYLTGEGAKRYLLRIQLEQARIMLLRNLDIPIVEIGNRCGFEDHSSFTRTFTQNIGMSPSDYRMTYGKG